LSRGSLARSTTGGFVVELAKAPWIFLGVGKRIFSKIHYGEGFVVELAKAPWFFLIRLEEDL